jgi:hypothetical protein
VSPGVSPRTHLRNAATLPYRETEQAPTGAISHGSAYKLADSGVTSTAPTSQSAMKQNGDSSTPHRTSKSFSPHVLESTRTVSRGTGTSEAPKAKRDSGKRSLWRNVTGRLPTYVVTGLKDTRSWKTFARCMIALFGAVLLMLVQECESGSSHRRSLKQVDTPYMSLINAITILLLTLCAVLSVRGLHSESRIDESE